MAMKKVFILSIAFIVLLACSDEEDVLSVDNLYSDDLIEEFSIFDPCDTVSAPRYQLTSNVMSTDEITRLFSMSHPDGEILMLGRSTNGTGEVNSSTLSYHGMTIKESISNDPVFILFEDNNDDFGFEHVYVIGKQSSFSSSYLFITSTDNLAPATFGDGDVFKLEMHEIVESGGDIQVVNSFNLTATSGNSANINYDYQVIGGPDRTKLDKIRRYITGMKEGSHPFSPALQALKFKLQLGLHQRDLRFAKGMLIDNDLLGRLNSKNQEVIEAIDNFMEVKTITAFFCLSDSGVTNTSSDIAPSLVSPLD